MAKRSILTQKVKKSITDYVNILKKDKLPIQKVIVFGSQVQGISHKYSDIDLCIISPRFKDDFKDLHYLLMKSYEVDGIIEPHPYHPKDFVNEDPLVWEIKKTGVEIK